MKSERPKSKVKPDKVTIPFKASAAFRAGLQAKAKEEHRDVSKIIRMVLRERYPDLPEE